MKLVNYLMSVAATVLFFSTTMIGGCSSQADVICHLICDCESCTDERESNTCIDTETQQNIADIYGCTDDWQALATCIQENGRCDPTTQEGSSFTTDDHCNNASANLDACIDAASAHGGVAPRP